MGFFDKIKQNFTRGGVKVKVQAASSISMQDGAVPVAVLVTASGTPQVITGVVVEIVGESQNQSFNNNANATPASPKVLARAEHAERFTLAAGETRDITVTLVMNTGAALQDALPEGSAAAGVAHALQQLQTVSDAFSHESYRYYIRAVADVEGVAFDPSDQQDIQITKPGEIGIAGQIKF